MKVTRFGWLAALSALLLFAAACSGTDQGAAEPTADAAADDAGGGENSDITIGMVTHGDGGGFWSVAKAGAEQAAADLGVSLNYQESNNDPQAQAQLIESAVSAGIDGLAVSAPNPEAIQDAVAAATSAGIPVITLNSGLGEISGAMTHVGQTEDIAGQGAGERLAAEGATNLLCVIHEEGNIGLQQRCDGARETFGGDVEDFNVSGTGDVAATLTEIQSKLESDTSINAVLALNPDIAVAAVDAVAGAGSEAVLATFDLSGDVIQGIIDGDILFAVDQQQYLQGYLPVVMLYLNVTNANTVGGGLPVLTGPGFVDASNAEQVQALTEAGTR
ncbi:MAG TPA: substrate-binding domain-containing protein [Egibacteraceae bacterium]|nr:substrate-binding domain-containing protein [Egibacteraceae bacterium]